MHLHRVAEGQFFFIKSGITSFVQKKYLKQHILDSYFNSWIVSALVSVIVGVSLGTLVSVWECSMRNELNPTVITRHFWGKICKLYIPTACC